MFDELNPFGKHADFMSFYGDVCDDPRDPVARRIAVMHKRNVAFGGKGGRAPDPNPGMLASAEAAKEVAAMQKQTATEMLDFYKTQYAEMKPIMTEIMQTDMNIQRANAARADEYADYERETFRPVEKRLVKDAEEYSTEGKREALATQAAADVNTAFTNTRAQEGRSLSRMGVNPNSGRFAALNNQLSLGQAATAAGAMTQTRTDAEQLGFARRMDAAGLGRNLAGNASTAYGVSLNAGEGARTNAMAAGNQMGQGYGAAGQAYGGAASSYGQAGNIYGQEFQGRMQGYQAQQQAQGAMWQGIGSAVGVGAGLAMRSSKDDKTNKAEVKKGSALKGLRKLDVEQWDYKKGVEDEGRHVGAYAEDFKREFGVGNGKNINVVDALGVTMKSIQDLADKVDRIGGKATPVKRANGGGIHRGKGPVRGPGGPVDDKIPAMLSNGEYVLPADTTAKVGKAKLDKLVKETHTPAAVQRKRKALKGRK